MKGMGATNNNGNGLCCLFGILCCRVWIKTALSRLPVPKWSYRGPKMVHIVYEWQSVHESFMRRRHHWMTWYWCSAGWCNSLPAAPACPVIWFAWYALLPSLDPDIARMCNDGDGYLHKYMCCLCIPFLKVDLETEQRRETSHCASLPCWLPFAKRKWLMMKT